MFKEVFVLVLAAVACHAEVPAPSQAVFCGKMPKNIFLCTSLSSLFTPDVITKCKSVVTPCAKLTCLLTQSGCMTDGKVDKPRARAFFDSYLSTHSAWSQAVNHLKAACLGDKAVPPQGTYLDCPAFDILHCALTSFIKNVPESQWVQSSECAATRRYAQACPICPDECFATQVPNDSCHACQALPRSA